MRALDDPAIAPEGLAGVDPLARNARRDASGAAGGPAAGDVVRLVGMELGGPVATMPLRRRDPRDRVEERFEADRVVPVGRPQDYGQRDPMAVRNHVALRARLALIR